MFKTQVKQELFKNLGLGNARIRRSAIKSHSTVLHLATVVNNDNFDGEKKLHIS